MPDDPADPVSSPSAWATRASSAASSESLTALAGVDPAALSGADLVDAIVASEKALSLLSGTQMRLIAALAEPFVAGDPMKLAARLARKNCAINDDSDEMVQALVPDAAISLASAEVAAALRISPVTAGIRVREAGTMTSVLAPTLSALEKGVLDRGKARVIAEHCEPLNPENKAAVQELVLPLAGASTTSELRDLTGQAVITVDPDGCDERHRAAAARRELAIKALPDAMATLKAFLPADGAVKIFQLADLLATATAGVDGDNRGIGARRIDAWVDVADQLMTSGFIDLSHYLGNPLSDHGTPRARTGTEGGRSADEQTQSADAIPDQSTGPDCKDLPQMPSAVDLPAPASASQPEGGTIIEPAADASPNANKITIADTTPAATSTATARKVRRSGQATAGSQSVAGKPCDACGSTGRGARSLTRQGRRPHLSVTLGLGTLAELDNLPGKLAGFGAIPPGLARSIAKSAATITALQADPEIGSITNAGALVYRPRQALRDQISALLETCQFPSCRQPVWRCDIDHREPFDHQNPEQGGRTTQENTGPYCRRHHLFKHHTEWQTRPDPVSGTLIWISPTSHRYVKGRSQAAPPDIWVATGGTDLAERLDNMRATVDVDHGTRAPGSVPEELLTAMLLQKELNRPPYEYDPVVRDCAPDDSASSRGDSEDCASNRGTSGDTASNRGASEDCASNRGTSGDSAAHRGTSGDGASNCGATDQQGSVRGNQEATDAAAPNAQSWSTFDEPPPF